MRVSHADGRVHAQTDAGLGSYEALVEKKLFLATNIHASSLPLRVA